MPIPKELALTPEQLDEIMSTSWNMRIASVGPGERINLTPLWFTWVDGKIYTHCRGQKVVNFRRNPNATILVDLNEQFPQLKGAMFQGKVTVLENSEAENADPGLEAARVQWATKYAGGHGETDRPARNEATARGRTGRWIVFNCEKLITWDNEKLGNLTRRRE